MGRALIAGPDTTLWMSLAEPGLQKERKETRDRAGHVDKLEAQRQFTSKPESW